MNNSSPPNRASTVFIHSLIFMLPFLALISSFGVGLCSFAFLLAAIFYRRPAMAALRPHMPAVRPVLIAFALALLLAVLNLCFSSGVLLRDMEKPTRMLAAATVMLTVLALRPQRRALWWGLIAGSIAGAIFIAYQRWGLGVDRPGGLINSITFGDIVLCMGLLCLAGMQDFPGRAALWPGLGALAGLFGSIASGTRGGWLAIVFALIVLLRYSHVLRGRLRKGLALLALALMVSTFFIPQTGARVRVDQGINDVEQYLNGGETYTNVGIRFELWRSAVQLIKQHPLLGLNPVSERSELQALVVQGRVHPYVLDFPHYHNDILQMLVFGGVTGLLVWAGTLVVPMLFFVRMLNCPEASRNGAYAPALAGLLLVLSYFAFGLTEVIFWSVRSCMFYALMLFLLIGLCLNTQLPPASGEKA
ncbi:O-antigen ligase family protein [Pseudoduganella danionis]|uniref:O-antigen ligase family protein n=1 Tax=Pseudoduganella danionis TaxID=1890295 RepID=A0ABW9SIT9_9BURK|nr:O-antigen ligase family protein [Pseudoduganella danionis]MTW31696.1 O-antigen ligase family protein [Pseudoduganella danionis]